MLEEPVDRVRGEQAVATDQAGVVGRQVLAVPAPRPDPARSVTAVPPDLIAVFAVALVAVEVADREVLHPHVVRLEDLDAVDVLSVAPVDDDAVSLQPAH